MRRRRSESSLDRHRRQTQTRLIVSGMLILMIVGGGLVWAIYGPGAALTAVLCLLVCFGLFGLLWLLLSLLEAWVREDEP